MHNPHVMLPSPRKFLFLCGVTPFWEHYTPSELVQCSLRGVARCECRWRVSYGAADVLVGVCIRIGYEHPDSLLTYPDADNLSISS